jgi:predicted permease
MRRAFRLPFSRSRIDRMVDAELRFHLEGRIEELIARGMTPEEAEAEARRRFGDYQLYRRQARSIDAQTVRERSRLELIDALRQELRHSARALLRAPAYSLIAIVTLSLGIGATTAIYTLLETALLRPLPYTDAGELVAVVHPARVPGTGDATWRLSAAGYFHFRAENRTLADLGVYSVGTSTITGEQSAERVWAALVTHSLLTTLRARPALGRLILPSDDRRGAPPVVVLGYDFWQRRFGGDPRIVGRMIQMSDGSAEVIGVAERGLDLPASIGGSDHGDVTRSRIDLWAPLGLDPARRPENAHYLFGIGRLRPGVSAAEAERDLQVLTARFPELFPTAYSKAFMDDYSFRTRVQPLRDEVLGESLARTIWILFAAVGLVLVIACANVANLFMVRLEARRRESAVRTALGASRAQMVMHYLSESLALCLAAGALAMLLADVGLTALLSLAPRDMPRLSEVELRWTSFAFAALLSLVIGLVLGVVPLARKGIDLATLRDGARGLGASRSQRIVRNLLVVGQVALALLLMASAGLLVRSVSHLRGVRPGLESAGVLVFEAALPRQSYDTQEKAAAFHREFQARLAALPGVQQVGATTFLPLEDFGHCAVVFREGRPYAPDEEPPCVSVPRVTPGFLRALGIQVRGRIPEWSDVDANTGAVVVTRALADRLWPGEDPIGKGINSGGIGNQPGFFRVVGVIPELRGHGLDKPPSEAVFYAAVPVRNAWLWEPMIAVTYAVRSSGGAPTAQLPAIRRILAELDPRIALANAQTLEEAVARSMARTSFIMTLMSVAASMALLLSAVGLYGVISYVVAQRRSEIGVRMALGARVPQIARLVVGQTIRLALAGTVLGLAAALAGTRLIRSLLFEVSPTDPVVLSLVALLLLAIAAAASFGPARRAASVDPVEALRSE